MKRLSAIIIIAVGLAGCSRGPEREPVFPVNGQLFYDGKPAANATVIFHPLNGGELRPRGKVNPDGSFKLTTYDGDDGAPKGEYRVTVEWWLSSGKDDAPTNRLPAKLGNPDTSGLTASVGGITEVPAFNIRK